MELQLSLAEAPLESVARDVLFVRLANRNKYILVISDCFISLTKNVPIQGLSAAEVEKLFVNERCFKNGN